MDENIKLKYVVVPNHNDVCLPNVKCIITATNKYDSNVFSKLKEGDNFVMSYSQLENAYGDFDNLILPFSNFPKDFCPQFKG